MKYKIFKRKKKFKAKGNQMKNKKTFKAIKEFIQRAKELQVIREAKLIYQIKAKTEKI